MNHSQRSPLRLALHPTVTVLQAYRYASGARARRQAWSSASTGTKLLFVVVAALFLGMWATAVARQSYSELLLSAACSTLIVIAYKLLIMDRYMPIEQWKDFDEVFGLMYRFRRFLLFRDQLRTRGFDAKRIESVRGALLQEKQLLASRAVALGPLSTMCLAVVTSIFTTMSTREKLMESGLTFLILAIAILGASVAAIIRMSNPTAFQRHLELECFMHWYEMEAGEQDADGCVVEAIRETSVVPPEAAPAHVRPCGQEDAS